MDFYQQWGTAFLKANCLSRKHVPTYSILDLNRCIGNNNGEMIRQPDGNFSTSCDCDKLKGPPTYLYCICNSDTGRNNTWNAFELSNFITNDDGQLRCFNARGCSPNNDTCTLPWW
ncbi:hypothetical protein F5Y18DRAFT_405710 [Xylariaceae sp. FL1019]|nr:hypothetical protein F5Y18DRAFT_405710 [Xylariaceae sp. FL1019]